MKEININELEASYCIEERLEARLLLEKAQKLLPRVDFWAFALFALGYTQEEIANYLQESGITDRTYSQQAVSRIIARARKALFLLAGE